MLYIGNALVRLYMAYSGTVSNRGLLVKDIDGNSHLIPEFT